MPLDEVALRRPGFAEGVPIVLADGRAWHFPRPTIVLVPRVGADGRVDVAAQPALGPEYDTLLDDFYASAEGLDTLRAMMALAVALLSVNYDLRPADYAQLLRFAGQDDASQATWHEILEVATGQPPKTGPPGSAATS